MTHDAKPLVHRLRGPVTIALSVAVIALAAFGLHHALRHVHPRAVMDALRDLSMSKIATALLFVCGSFAAIGTQEYFALRTAGAPLPFPAAAFGGFLAQSIGHSSGFSAVIGGGLRYRLYSKWGVRPAEVAKVQASFSGTLALAMVFQLSIAMLFHPALFDQAITLPWDLIRGLGVVLLLIGGGALGATLRREPIEAFGYHWELPPTGYVVAQVACSLLDLVFLAAAAYVLLPDALDVEYSRVLGIAVASLVLGVVSAVPGGLGVFESSVLLLLGPTNHLVSVTFGALVAFRALYYLLPLVLGLLSLGALELYRRGRKTIVAPSR